MRHTIGFQAHIVCSRKRMSQRGHGQVSIEALDLEAGTGTIVARHSAFALGYGPEAGRCVCYVFQGSFADGMRYLLECVGRTGEPVCHEVACAASGATECRFDLRCEALG